jgi:hypothetical protein
MNLQKVDLDSKDKSEQDDALEFYMKKCLHLECQVELLTERVEKLEQELEIK